MRQCAFCSCTSSLTGEHLRSDWVNKLLDGRTHHYVINQRSYGTKPTQWEDKKLDLKANVVCGNCNSGWMSDLDNDAKGVLQDIILHDCNICILPLGLVAIAAFTMKCAFVGDCLTKHRKPFFDQKTRMEFARTHQPTEGAHMWLGRIQQPRGKKTGIYKTRYGISPPTLDTYVFTFSIETIMLQLAIMRFTDPFGNSAYSPELNQEKRLNGVLVPSWPPRVFGNHIEWPPPENIHSTRLEEIADRFTDLTLTR